MKMQGDRGISCEVTDFVYREMAYRSQEQIICTMDFWGRIGENMSGLLRKSTDAAMGNILGSRKARCGSVSGFRLEGGGRERDQNPRFAPREYGSIHTIEHE
jgi:hypothetical protein